MGSKSPYNNEKITISDDSECEIQEVDIKSITIPDSPESTALIDDDDNDQNQQQNDDPNKSVDLLDTTNEEIYEDNQNQWVFEVNFKSEQHFKEYKDLVLKSFRSTFAGKDLLIVEDDTKIQVFREDTQLDDAQETTNDHQLTESKKLETSIESKVSSEDEDMNIAGLFMIDTEPAEKVDFGKIPSYKRTIKEILDEGSSEKKKKTDDECERPKQKKCFNCDKTDHDLRSCPKPRNMTKINKAKKSMNQRRERYHVDIEQRFAHLRPGQVSKQLREALGIGSGELPFFFYRMRVLGYPPGWLEDARVAHSGIALFDSEGRFVRDPEDEEGEVDSDKNKYDVNKIIGFPGFNTDPGKNFYDDYKHHNVPPFNKENCKEKFIEMLGDNVVKGYKRKKLKILPDGDSSITEEKSTLEVSEMEIEDEENLSIVNVEFTRPPPPPSPPNDGSSKAPPPPPPPPPSQPPPESPNASIKRSPSPSLEDLEKKQQLLKDLLQSSSITISDNDDSLIDEVLALDADTSSISVRATPNKSELNIKLPEEPEKTANSSVPLLVNNEVTNSEESATPKTPLATAIESVEGTPLLKFSPFDKLPSGDNFKVGVSDVINFENLPDSTGTYEKMKGVIKKVRTAVTKLNNEDS